MRSQWLKPIQEGSLPDLPRASLNELPLSEHLPVSDELPAIPEEQNRERECGRSTGRSVNTTRRGWPSTPPDSIDTGSDPTLKSSKFDGFSKRGWQSTPDDDAANSQEHQPKLPHHVAMAWQRHMTDNIVKVLFKSSEMALELGAIRQQVERMESLMDSWRVDAVVDHLGATAPASQRWFRASADNARQDKARQDKGIFAAPELSQAHAASELEAVKEQVGRVEFMLTEQQAQVPKDEGQQGLASEVATRLEDRLSTELGERLEASLARKLDDLQEQQKLRFEELMTLSIRNRESELNVREVLAVCQQAAEGVQELRRTAEQAEINYVQSQAIEITDRARFQSDQHFKPPLSCKTLRLSESSALVAGSSYATVLENAATPELPQTRREMSRHLEDIEGRRSIATSPQEESVRRLLRCLDLYAAVLIIASLLYLGIDLLVGMPYAIRGKDPPNGLAVVDHVFTVGFVLEILTRISVEKCAFLTGPGRLWNIFAFLLTAFQVFNSFGWSYNFTLLRVAGIIKIVRITAVFRTVKDMRAFRLMISASTWQPIFWGGITFCGVLYIFALIVGQIVQVGVLERTKRGAEIDEYVLEFYGSLQQIMATLFMAVTGGDPWRESIFVLGQVADHVLGELIFVVFVFFMTFGVMNTINAVYIDRVIHNSEHLRFVVMSESAVRDRHRLGLLRELLNEVDLNANGKIRYTEFSDVIHSTQAEELLQHLDLEVPAVMALFRLLENINDDRSSVDIHEFMNSLAGLKEGSVMQLLLSTLVFRGDMQLKRLDSTFKSMDKHFSKVLEAVTKVEGDLLHVLSTIKQHTDRDID